MIVFLLHLQEKDKSIAIIGPDLGLFPQPPPLSAGLRAVDGEVISVDLSEVHYHIHLPVSGSCDHICPLDLEAAPDRSSPEPRESVYGWYGTERPGISPALWKVPSPLHCMCFGVSPDQKPGYSLLIINEKVEVL